MSLVHLPRLLQQLGAAEFADDEGRERFVTSGWDLEFEDIGAAEFGFEMLECACLQIKGTVCGRRLTGLG